MRRLKVQMRLGVLLLQCAVVFACVAVTTVVAMSVQERSIRAATEERVLAVANSLAELDSVREGVLLPIDEATAQLQPLADIVERAAGVDFVVITDAAGKRITHPDDTRRGQVVSTDASSVLDGESFLGTEHGTLGESLRAKVPVVVDDDVVGTLSVGIRVDELSADFNEAVLSLLPWVVGAALVGLLGSVGLSSVLNRRLRTLESDVAELEVQARIGAALREQTHEFHTRMHVVRAFVARGDHNEALGYIDTVVPVSGANERNVSDRTYGALLDAIEAEIGAHGTRLDVEASEEPEQGTLADADLVLLSNLCRNAAEAGASVVKVSLGGNAKRLWGCVEDDGPGIPAQIAPRVFERGVTTKAGSGERGIGLDVVGRIVRERKGTIEIGKSPLGGARFSFDLRTAPPSERLG